MDALQLIALALIQGVTEFLPISSSGHLILPSQLLGWSDQGLAFDVAVHVGSLLAVVGYFRKDISKLFLAWIGSLRGQTSTDSKLAWFVIWATAPAGLAGLLFNDVIENHLRSVVVIASATALFGLVLGWADIKGARRQTLDQLTLSQAMLIGCAQALALIPGTSRSGITMTMGLAVGLKRQDAARFSFLLSIPLIALSGGYKAVGLIGESSIFWMDILLGVILSAMSATLCIHWFLKWIDNLGMWPFVLYRLALAAVLLMFFA
ncbi:undecaprenyl-diphosphate phosphatase [Pseudomaricurvus alkylphenolicus]|uniref:undecaprenyl-diphosphate phosphatase n=1 Tax=Pseudomaricurvus alkylphenolicus TaxID=1306991 RepID=UPI00141F2541|nr:undecaprenyl-diphosphate phosphatase [Pseudomaricurvus alkylphenolicus]NIB43292.1 undecaprenyl-diphosphate phosphatase [Pseudomaricurvus alkylphenolicus]